VDKKGTAADARRSAEAAVAALEGLEDFSAEAVEAALRPLVDQLGLKARSIFGTIRVACTGKAVAPPLFETLSIIGQEVTLRRLRQAVLLLPDAA